MKTFLLISALILVFCSIGLAQPYWNTAHVSNWGNGDIPPSGIPWKAITHLIYFAGGTGGAQTNGSPPYFQAPSNYEAAYSQQLHALSKQYGVKYILDLGFNQSGQFCAVARVAGGIGLWAQTVGNYIIQYGWDGADFDLEGGGCYADINLFAKALHDYLALKNPAKKYDLTTSIMPNGYDVRGWNVPAAVANGYLDQCNPMFYDECYPETSPLFRSSTHGCWSNDSAVAFAFAATGIPKNKIGVGYASQIYLGCNTCYGIFHQQIGRMLDASGKVIEAGVQWDSESKARWFSFNGVNIAYEDTLTGWWKADFVKRNGFGGGMTFCLDRGYLPNPPPGWLHNPAAEGFGRALLGAGPPPCDTCHVPPPCDTCNPPPVIRPVLVGFQLTRKSTQLPIVTLKQGMTLNVHPYLGDMTIQALDSGATAKSVTFVVNNASYTTNGPPFFFGWPWSKTQAMVIGQNNLVANGWSAMNATGAASATLSITITVVDDSITPPPPANFYSQAQLESAKGVAHTQGMADERALIPDSSDVVVVPPPVQPPAVKVRVGNPKP